MTAMSLPGIDVSSFQGLPQAWMAKAGSISWAAVKISELQPSGFRYVNPDAAADWAALKAAGKGRVAYLFGHPSTDATATVGLFTSQMRALGLDDADAVCLDHEVSDGRSPASVAGWGREVLGRLRATFDRPPLLYTFLSFAAAGNCAGMGSFPLWIADPSSPEGRPRIPEPWKSWAIHQYRIAGGIDRDLASYPTLDAMQAALGRPRPPAKGPAVTEHVTQGNLSLSGLCAKHPGATPAEVLRLTPRHSPGGVFPGNVAHWINEVFDGARDAQADVPAGLHLYLPAAKPA